MRMAWLLLVLVLFVNLCINGFSEPLNNNTPLGAVVVGTVFCDTCFHQPLSKSPHFIPGAIVEVECKDEKTSKTSLKQQLKTNKHGNFKAALPFSVAKNTKTIETCSVKLIKSSQPLCSVPASATSSSLKFKNSSNKNGVPLFSAGLFSFKPAFCAQKSRPQLPFPPIVPPVIQPPPSFLPPNPLMPPPLVPNPFQPPTPVIPNPFQPPAPAIPNPLPPLPPLPFFSPPTPPPSLFPPSIVPPFLPPLIPIPGIPSGPPMQKTSPPIKQSP